MNLRVDGEKLHFHPKAVAQWLDAGTWEQVKDVAPLYVEISPVGACNHRCTFCAVDYIGYKARMLDPGRLGEVLWNMGAFGVKAVMYAGEGEPLLHRAINRIVEDTLRSGIHVSFTTNGVLLDKLETGSQCHWIKVSLNAGTRATYAAVHRTKEDDWDKAWSAIRSFGKRKGKCDLGVQMVLLPENVHEIGALYRLCEENGVDYLVAKPYSQHKRSITHQYEGKTPHDPFLDAIPKGRCQFIYREETAKTKAIPYSKCHATPHFWAYIMATGDVYSCSAYLLDERFRLGNINRETFTEIWQGERRHENWTLVEKHLDIHECRVNCRMDKVNRYLDELTKGAHNVNFI